MNTHSWHLENGVERHFNGEKIIRNRQQKKLLVASVSQTSHVENRVMSAQNVTLRA